MACACVILGNAPTRTTVWPSAGSARIRKSNPATKMNRLFIFAPARIPVNHHGQNGGRHTFFLTALAGFQSGHAPAIHDVSQSSVLENPGCGIAYGKENLIECAMFRVAIDQSAYLVGIAKGSQPTVNQADNLAQVDLCGIAAQLIAALGAAYAFHHACVLE